MTKEPSATGVVASPHYLATEVGIRLLAQGGSAFDAAVGVSLAIGVVQPYHSGIGGGGSIAYFTKQGLFGCYQGRGSAPALLKRSLFIEENDTPNYNLARNGSIACVVPALVPTLRLMHDAFGVLAWKTILDKVIPLAREGFLADKFMAKQTNNVDAREKIDSHANTGLFSEMIKEGQTILQPEMARTLSAISDDPNEVIDGPIAGSLSQTVKEVDGVLSVDDLKHYRPFEQNLVEGKYRQWRVLAPATPTIGALQVLLALQILGNFELSNCVPGSPEHLHLVAEALKLSFIARGSLDNEAEALSLSEPDKAADMAQLINSNKALDTETFYGQSDAESCTSHFSVADKEGNVVCQTQTIGGAFGSGIIDSTTGIVLNNLIGDFSLRVGDVTTQGIRYGSYNLLKPGSEPASSQSPMIAINQETNEMLTVGAAGGPKIVSASVQALVNFIDFGMGTKGSVNAPRLHCHGRQLEVEPGISVGVLARLREIGHDVVTVPHIALLQMIHKSTGGWEGASDSRGPGRASILIEDSGHIVSRDFGYSNSQP